MKNSQRKERTLGKLLSEIVRDESVLRTRERNSTERSGKIGIKRCSLSLTVYKAFED